MSSSCHCWASEPGAPQKTSLGFSQLKRCLFLWQAWVSIPQSFKSAARQQPGLTAEFAVVLVDKHCHSPYSCTKDAARNTVPSQLTPRQEATKCPQSLCCLWLESSSAFSPHFTVPGSTPTMFRPPQPWAWQLGQCPVWLFSSPKFLQQVVRRGLTHSLPMGCTGRGHTLCSGFGKLKVFQVTDRLSFAITRNTGLESRLSTHLHKFRPLDGT